MEKNWIPIIKATGSVGLVGLILHYVLQKIYSDKIIDLFGSEKLFTITLLIISLLVAALITAIFLHKAPPSASEAKKEPEKEPEKEQKGPTVNYNNDATHNGNNNF